MGFWACQGRWVSQILLQVFEGVLCLLCPLELVLFFEELKKWESPYAEWRDESAQGSHTSHQILDIMEALGWLHHGGYMASFRIREESRSPFLKNITIDLSSTSMMTFFSLQKHWMYSQSDSLFF
jgi:hypothetical protein